MLHVPNSFNQSKSILDKHIKECVAYSRSYKLATERIDNDMRHYKAAWTMPNIPYLEGTILEQQLAVSQICPSHRAKTIIKETACRLKPLGRVEAKVYNGDGKHHFIVLDTGTLDFMGNMACVIFAAFEQDYGHYNYGIEEQAFVSMFWQLALLYHDGGLKTNNEALVFPHFRSERLQPTARPYAELLKISAVNFFIYHEFGHIIDGIESGYGNSVSEELSADSFSFTAMRETAFAYNEPAVVEFTLIGCVLALACLSFIESTFPGLEFTRKGKTGRFPQSPLQYPNARLRLEHLLDEFPASKRAQLETHRVYLTIQKMFDKYSRSIKNGARPSSEYWDFQEFKLRSHNEGKTVTLGTRTAYGLTIEELTRLASSKSQNSKGHRERKSSGQAFWLAIILIVVAVLVFLVYSAGGRQ